MQCCLSGSLWNSINFSSSHDGKLDLGNCISIVHLVAFFWWSPFWISIFDRVIALTSTVLVRGDICNQCLCWNSSIINKLVVESRNFSLLDYDNAMYNNITDATRQFRLQEVTLVVEFAHISLKSDQSTSWWKGCCLYSTPYQLRLLLFIWFRAYRIRISKPMVNERLRFNGCLYCQISPPRHTKQKQMFPKTYITQYTFCGNCVKVGWLFF